MTRTHNRYGTYDALKWFSKNPGRWTANAVEKLSGYPVTTISKALTRLADNGAWCQRIAGTSPAEYEVHEYELDLVLQTFHVTPRPATAPSQPKAAPTQMDRIEMKLDRLIKALE